MNPGPLWLNKQDAAAKLARGGVLLLATDTVVGLHCRADMASAVARIQSLKARNAAQPLLLLAGGQDQVQLVAEPLSEVQAAYCRRCWPGPFTLILKARADLAVHLDAGGDTVAVRIPAWADLRNLIELVGFPLVSTSANRAGEPPCGNLQQAAALFGGSVDGIWDGKCGGSDDHVPDRPSALIDISTWPPRILRQGPRPTPEWDPVSGS